MQSKAHHHLPQPIWNPENIALTLLIALLFVILLFLFLTVLAGTAQATDMARGPAGITQGYVGLFYPSCDTASMMRASSWV